MAAPADITIKNLNGEWTLVGYLSSSNASVSMSYELIG